MKKSEKKTMYIGLSAVGLAVILGLYLKNKKKGETGNKTETPLASDVNFGI